MTIVRNGSSLLLLGLTAGCSLFFVDAPTRVPSAKNPEVTVMRHDEHGEVACTSGKGFPLADTIIGAGTLIGTAEGTIYYTTKSGDSGPVPGVILATAFLSSAIYGFVITGNCRDAKKYWAEHKNQELERAGELEN